MADLAEKDKSHFSSNGNDQLISSTNIPISDSTSIREYVHRYHHHGFFNEIYDLIIEQAHFQLDQRGRRSFGFYLSLFSDGASITEKEINLNINVLEITEILTDFFLRNPNIFRQFFPEYKNQQVDQARLSGHFFNRVRVAMTPVDKALSGIIRATMAYMDGVIDNQTLTRLSGIIPYLQSDTQSNLKLEQFISQKILSIIHEHGHIFFDRLAQYYGLTLDPNAIHLPETENQFPQLVKLHKQLLAEVSFHDHPTFSTLTEKGHRYLQILFAKLHQAAQAEESSNFKVVEYAKHLYSTGLQEILLRIITAQAEKKTDQETIQLLNQELFENSGYLLKFQGIILPYVPEIIALIQEHGKQQAFSETLERYYNDQAFTDYMNSQTLLAHLDTIDEPSLPSKKNGRLANLLRRIIQGKI